MLSACGGEASPLRVGAEDSPTGGSAGSAGFNPAPGGGGSGTTGGSGSSRNPLTVQVTDLDEMEIELVTLRCAGECAEVQAVARGGNPPYEIVWSDGSTEATRELCPRATTSYEVTAIDTPIVTDEFSYGGSSKVARVTAEVLDCPDGGIPNTPDGSIDPEPQPQGCIDLEHSDDGRTPWQQCAHGTELINPASGTPFPGCEELNPNPEEPQLEHYARYAVYDGAPAEQETLGGKLCTPLSAGVPASTTITLVGALGAGDSIGFPNLDTTFYMELWGGSSACDEGELLWTHEGDFSAFSSTCVLFTPMRDHEFLHVVTRLRTGPGLVRSACTSPVLLSTQGTLCPAF